MGFIRCVWGIYENQKNRWYTRRPKIDNDIGLSILNPYAPKSKVYVFGEDNQKKMVDLGFDSVLIDKKPFVWDMENEQYRHKIEAWKYGLLDFEQVVFIDWDCVPIQPIPEDFWSVLASGPKIQATLYMYRKRRVRFRPSNERKMSASTFVYMRESNIANEIIDVWEKIGRPWQEEAALSKYIDDLDGGWKSVEEYKKYEPKFHCLFLNYNDISFLKNRPPIFYHYNRNVVSKLLGDRNAERIKIRLDHRYKNEVANLLAIKENKK